MTMKSQSKLSNTPLQRKIEGFSDDDSDYDIEYPLLSNGSADLCDGMEDHWVTINSCEQVAIPVAGKVECKNDTESEHGHVGIQELQEAGSSWQPDDLASQNPMSTMQIEDKMEVSSTLTSLIAEQEFKSRGTEHGVENAETRDENERAFEELERLMPLSVRSPAYCVFGPWQASPWRCLREKHSFWCPRLGVSNPRRTAGAERDWLDGKGVRQIEVTRGSFQSREHTRY